VADAARSPLPRTARIIVCDRMFLMRISSLFVQDENVSLWSRQPPHSAWGSEAPRLGLAVRTAHRTRLSNRSACCAPSMTWATTKRPRNRTKPIPAPSKAHLISAEIFRFEVTLDPVLCTYGIEARCQNLIMLRAARKG
jgi:hypothetical protein